MTRRMQATGERPDYSPLIRAIQYLDEVLKRGVVIGVYEDSLEVSDEDVKRALIAVTAQMDNCTVAMEKTMRSIARIQPSSIILQ